MISNIPKWIIEADVFEDNQDRLMEEIRKQGMEVSTMEYDHLNPPQSFHEWSAMHPVIFYGSLNLGMKIKRTQWIPGVYLNDKAYECTSYYPILGDMLIHSKYVMVPYGDLLRMKNFLFNEVFKDWSKLFIRPNSGIKPFTGMIIEKDKWEEGIKLAGFYGIESNMLVLISTVGALIKEWRFVVVDGKVITGSLYRDWSKKGEESSDYVLRNSISVKSECEEPKAFELAQQCANKYNPDNCWTIDITETHSGTFYVLEIGSFSCAGLYGCNLKKIVKAVTESAIKEWNDFYSPIL